MLMVVAAAALVAMLMGIRVERPIEAGGNRIALLLIEKGDCLRAQLSATDSVEHVVEGVRGIGAGKGDLLLLGLLERQADVLDEVLHHEARLPIAVERLGRKGVHSARCSRAGQDHLTGLLQVEAALLRERERVCHANHGGCKRDLVGKLGRLALARTAEAEDARGEGLQQRTDRFDVALGRTRDGRERAGDGTGLATRHRAVERRAVAHRCSLGDIARKRGRARGEVDENGTGLGGREQAVARQVELLDILWISHHREDDVRIAHCLRGRG